MGNLATKWRKVLKEALTLRPAGRFLQRHPSVLCLLFFLVILYKYFFSWFTLLLAASPIFLFTGFFLGIILAYGEPNNPENDHVYKKIQKVKSRNIHDNGKSAGGVSLQRILSSEEAKHNNREQKIQKGVQGGCSSSESGSAASDGSETDTHPMLHTFHQLRSGTSSSVSSQDGDSNERSTDDETEKEEVNADNEHDEEGVKVVAWSADDQKNILKIGCLEIERNQRLEMLIARHRVRKDVDRNLIDFGSGDSIPTVEELSKFNVQIPTVFAPRRNPFDLPYNEENFPDSAPSAPLKMRSTFDQTCEQEDEGSSTTGDNSSNVEPILVPSQPHISMALRRHESFTEGAPFLSDFWQDLQPSRFRPHFVMEKRASDGHAVPNLEGENSENSSVHDSESTSSVTDQGVQKELLEDSRNQGHVSSFSQTDEEPPLDQNMREIPCPLDIEPPVLISDSSDDDMSLPGGHINDWEEAQDTENLNSSHSIPLEDLSVMEYPQEMEMTSNDFHQMSPHSDDPELLSSSTESTNPFEVQKNEEPGKELEIIDDTQIADPVYDTSPSGSDKHSTTDSTVNAFFLQGGNGCTFDAEASMEEGCSPSRTKVASSETTMSSLHLVEESKLRQSKTSEISGHLSKNVVHEMS
ncbi:uncharacterized protein LOC100840168 [Brachypodium distachyon]|uniref:uncharacterized protein LOC100840168 n=1 Tax=Brachypodium distachyon TaxID=15368 RepID=UPI000234E665|nr:uncharacterized protein LOC100840168 [Brachypodium distachyon]|eukprot:XP_024313081.1 uncharacterized protein LOC100840168 [Brachypodium distachyon]